MKEKTINFILANPEFNINIDFEKYEISSVFNVKSEYMKITNKIFEDILRLGKYIDNICTSNSKEVYTCAYKNTGGNKQINFLKYEKEFIESIFYQNEKNKKIKYISNNVMESIRDKLSHYSQKYGINSGKGKCNLIDFLTNIHAIYELNNILDSIKKNKEIKSKIWDFCDDGKKLNKSEVATITHNISNKYILVKTTLQYIDGQPVQTIYGIIQVGFLHLIPKLTTSWNEIDLTNKRLRECKNCATLYLPKGNNQKFCSKCTNIGKSLKQARYRNKLKRNIKA